MKLLYSSFLILCMYSTPVDGMIESAIKLLRNKTTEIVILGCKNHIPTSPIKNPERDFNLIKSLIAAWSLKPYKTAVLNPFAQPSATLAEIEKMQQKEVYNNCTHDLLLSLRNYVDEQKAPYNYVTFIPMPLTTQSLEDFHTALHYLIMKLQEYTEEIDLLNLINIIMTTYSENIGDLPIPYNQYFEELTNICESYFQVLSKNPVSSQVHKVLLAAIDEVLRIIDELDDVFPSKEKVIYCTDAINTLALKTAKKTITKEKLIEQLEEIRALILALARIIHATNRLVSLINLDNTFRRIVIFVNSTEIAIISKELEEALICTPNFLSFSSAPIKNDGTTFVINSELLLEFSMHLLSHAADPMQFCITCNKENAANACSQCKTIRYCSIICQKEHWDQHKADCAVIVKSLSTPAITGALAVVKTWQ